MNKVNAIAISTLLILIIFNLFSVVRYNTPIIQAKLMAASLSRGDQYFGRLTLWYLFAKQGDWVNAGLIEPQIDPVDIIAYKTTHQPSELKKFVNNLVIKSNKTVEDWIELARVQSILGKSDDARESITRAKNIDPIRDDITQIYYRLYR